jgi:hypothetical protein
MLTLSLKRSIQKLMLGPWGWDKLDFFFFYVGN